MMVFCYVKNVKVFFGALGYFLLINCSPQHKIIQSYENYIKCFNDEKYHETLNYLQYLEKKAINKNFYRGRILYIADKINDSATFVQTLQRVNLSDSFFIQNQLKFNYSVINSWRSYWLNEINDARIPINPTLEEYYSNIFDLETRHRGKVNTVYQRVKSGEIDMTLFKQITDSIFKLQNPLDSISHAMFDKLVDSLGRIPCLKEVGIEQTRTVYMVMQHYKNNKTKLGYIELLEKEMLEGFFPYNYYTQIVDRYRSDLDLPLKFGQSVKFDENGNKDLYGNIKSLKKIMVNRAKFGINPINPTKP